VAEVVGLLHPGEMGAAIGAILRGAGTTVLWASEGRGRETADRAAAAGLEDARTVGDLGARADVILSVCPPHAARDVLASVGDFDGLYVDANAVSPATAHSLGEAAGRFVDGGIVGPPPAPGRPVRLYLSGTEAPSVAELFSGTVVDARVVSAEPGDASAVKMAYAAWTKGTAALLLAIRALARAEGVEEALLDEWELSLPELAQRSDRAAASAGTKGWRWVGEMEEIAATFADAGLPDGFHLAAAEVFRRSPRSAEASLDDVLAALR
jgi:3-hydroxyisobutyrate dehydrogenase-like beta-hydroxyacid dehydrogenase